MSRAAEFAGLAAAAAQPEIGIPVLAITHPRAAMGVFLLNWALALAILSAIMWVTVVLRPFAYLGLLAAFLMGVGGAYSIHKARKR